MAYGETAQTLNNAAVMFGAPPLDAEGDYLTPQQFGAVGDGMTDDTKAFRKLFKAAFEQGKENIKDPGDTWVHCKAIYIRAVRITSAARSLTMIWEPFLPCLR
ncbi:MAG: hypothetical protein K6F51_10405 [Acetatifactor sp.]|nr:hypothetical protein [Acetatifactor sp.]